MKKPLNWTMIRDNDVSGCRFEEWTSIWVYHICMYMSKWSPLYTYTFGEEHAHMVPCIWWNMYFNIIPLHFIHLLIWWSTNLLYPLPSICFPCIIIHKDWNLKYIVCQQLSVQLHKLHLPGMGTNLNLSTSFHIFCGVPMYV